MLTKKQRMMGMGKEGRGGRNEWMAIHNELCCNA